MRTANVYSYYRSLRIILAFAYSSWRTTMSAAEQLKSLRLARGQLKGTITRIENYANDDENFTAAKCELLLVRKDKLVNTFKDYEKIQLDILSLDETDPESMSTMEDRYFTIIAKLNSGVKGLSMSETQQNNNITTSKLPNIDIPYYNGKDFTKFTPFIDLFMAVIHNNKSLSDVQKLFYLRKFLQDDALSVIINLPLVNDSYKEALGLLKKRFDNQARLIINHINIILDLPSMQKGTAAAIRSFISGVQQQLYALKNLKQPIEQWDMLLISILTKKLDQYTNRSYQLDRNSETLPTMEEFLSFLEKRAMALEDSSQTSLCEVKEFKRITPIKVTNVATKKEQKCLYCEGTNHAIYGCVKYKMAPIEDRLKFVELQKLCTVCLKLHSEKCKFNFSCKICKAGHNTLLHKDGNSEKDSLVSLHTQNSSKNILLPTIKVKLFDNYGREVFVRALLDPASQASFVTTQLVKRLSLKTKNQNTTIIGIGNKNNNVNKYVDIKINSPINNVQMDVKCNVVDSITADLPQQHISLSSFLIPKHIQLSDDEFNIPTEISMLLGADIYFDILLKDQIKIHKGPMLQNTLFGYTIGGCVNNQPCSDDILVTNLVICNQKKLEDVMEQFWLSEALPQPATKASTEFQKSEKCFKKSLKYEDKKFSVDMPLVAPMDQLQIGDSFSVALQRFLTLERRFKKNPLYLEKYKKFIEEYISLGHAKIVELDKIDVQNDPIYFLAHHAVLNEESLTTKLRVVFDGSMKSRAGLSLNDVMLNGPIVQAELFDIILLWRTYTHTITCDIQKMFRGILINHPQTSLQNILWRDSPNKPICCLQLQTVTYGLKSSSFLATRCLVELARMYQTEYPLASQALLKNTYVDDVISGTDELLELHKLKNELVKLLEKGSFTLHKWCSNSPQVIDDLPSEQKYFDKLDINKDNIVKTLGLSCDVLNDQLTFSCPSMTENENMNTKRKVLSFIGKMFDPLGLIGPIIVVAKIFMQQLWSLNLDWDSILPQEQLKCWNIFIKNLIEMGTLTIPRALKSPNIVSVELVGYADASMKAFGCCLYLRVFNSNGTISTNLICSKSRIAPLNKGLTIPKLELNSALLLSQLTNRASKVLSERLQFNVFLYSDSQIVLAWIQSQNLKSEPYVLKRISEIKDLTKEFFWSYVRTDSNPADLLSRGCEPHKIKSKELWWHGPKELAHQDFQHKQQEIKLPIPSILEDELVVNVCEESQNVESLTDHIEKNSDVGKLQRVIAYLLRFKNNCLKNGAKLTGPLMPKELNEAMMTIIKVVQIKHFSNEIHSIQNGSPVKSGLSNLHPFIDKNGILRVGGRLQNSVDMPYDRIHPIILPKSSHFTNILIHKEHLRLFHAGAKLVLSSLSQKYWLISGISEVKKLVNRCTKCARLKAAAAKQLMGSLPKERLTPVRAFHIVGLDFCGPFNVKVSRIRKPIITKGYIAIFVCFATKAIHVELVSDLTTTAFLACLKRFISRRAMPQKIFCDNASTFKGASNELKLLYDLFSSENHVESVKDYCLSNYIEFKFIPPHAPEFGGLWEAGVKSLKFHLKRIVGNISLTFEGLYTVITEIEAILNSRPLLPISSDISDYQYLSPGHFLVGTALTTYPETNYTHKCIDRLKFWQMLTKIKQDFWRVWSRDYLTQLQSRPKWKQDHPNLKEGDLVVVRTDNTPPLTWPMARIIRTVPGPDGKIRVAEIKMNDKTYVRSFRKLCPLPM